MDGAPGEIRTPDRSVRSRAGEPISYLISIACDLDQSNEFSNKECK